MLINPSDPTRAEIAASFSLWGVFVDPLGVDTRQRFDAMTEADRLEIMIACGYAPENCEGCNAPMNNAEEGLCPECAADRSATDE